MSFKEMVIENLYTKSDLSEIFDNIKIIREGIYNLNPNDSFFFVDLEKKVRKIDFILMISSVKTRVIF
tara:strand:- start:704 stop:907 length:204 start_codon:yes stop_codon:yes gene_type:complete